MEAIKAVPEKREGPKEKPSGIGKSRNCVLIRQKINNLNLTHKTKCNIFEISGTTLFLNIYLMRGTFDTFPRPEQANSVNRNYIVFAAGVSLKLTVLTYLI